MNNRKSNQRYKRVLRLGIICIIFSIIFACYYKQPVYNIPDKKPASEPPVVIIPPVKPRILKKNKVIIFSGHVKNPPTKTDNRGAKSYSGKFEYEFNDAIVRNFKINSYQRREIEYFIIQASENIGLKQKVKFANIIKPDIYLEIHHDSAQPGDIKKARKAGINSRLWKDISGFSTHYSEKSSFPGKSKKFAQILSDEMLKSGFKPNLYHADVEGMKCVDRRRGMYNRIPPNGLYVLYNIKSPSLLIECGNIVNPNEEQLMSEEKIKVKIIRAINNALGKYFCIDEIY